jgi:lysozyme family protein
MVASNFPAGLTFVWQPQFDSPSQDVHDEQGDSGGLTNGGVIEATWLDAVQRGLVSGSLRDATRDQLATVLRDEFWGPACDALPNGIDVMLFNGRMMSGHYPRLFQSCLGFMGEDVDGDIGPVTQGAARTAAPATLVNALSGAHYAYLSGLSSWAEFGHGWATRLQAARSMALGMIRGASVAV